MVATTRSADDVSMFEQLQASVAEISKTMAEMSKQIGNNNSRINGFLTQQQYLTDELQRVRNGEGASNRGSQITRLTKLEFPKFDGTDVKEWLYHCNQFFVVDRIDEDDKIRIASIHLQKKALTWHQQFIRHTGLVQVYNDEFEALLNKVEVNEKQAISLYVAGLQKEIEMPVRMFRPRTLEDAMCLAKMQEETLTATRKSFDQYTPKVTATSNRRQLTQKEIEEKRAKHLCFYCDEKYVPGHKCSGQLYSLEVLGASEADNDEPAFDCNDEIMWEDGIEKDEYTQVISLNALNGTPQISLNALKGANSYQLMRVMGHIRDHSLDILIDSGSSHNFLDLATTKQLGCKLEGIDPMLVLVPGGSKLMSTNQCEKLTWQICGQTFTSDMVFIPLGGSEMVLGIHWLKTLGDIVWNFKNLKMTFHYMGKKVELRGKQKVDAKGQHRSTAQLNAMHLCVYPASLWSMEMQEGKADVQGQTLAFQSLLHKYQDIFVVPTQLPPKRSCDHKISLKPDTQPINLRPYRHSPTQKDAIEDMVKELLDSGVIRSSQSPYSSPIVLVKKKDGSWCMCVDYRELNKHTIKDKFPIPLVEELIDELGGSQIFSKLDLRSGYHRIRMHDQDIEKTAFRTHEGHYEFLVMPFGLTNAPSTFQALMNEVFKPFLRKFTLVFFDDILVYSSNLQEHLKHLEMVLKVMQQHQLFAKMSKCVFGTNKVEYLGHVISDKGVSTDPSKIEAMANWPMPINLKQLRGSLD
ncbi:uncharacterized protein [Rutidosis leptorrhynchoides]|uniref:uncharacterized protein n=1 Tax=Rutidosis leptorrhynchoides TaxID=125765 RepID=UPI003A995FF4